MPPNDFKRDGTVTKRGKRRRVAALRGALAEFYGVTERVDAAALLIDALTDLRHFADVYGFAFASCDRTAYTHYLKENR